MPPDYQRTLWLSNERACTAGHARAVPLSSLYRKHGKYLSQFVHATNHLRKAGFPLKPGAKEAKTQAAESDVP